MTRLETFRKTVAGAALGAVLAGVLAPQAAAGERAPDMHFSAIEAAASRLEQSTRAIRIAIGAYDDMMKAVAAAAAKPGTDQERMEDISLTVASYYGEMERFDIVPARITEDGADAARLADLYTDQLMQHFETKGPQQLFDALEEMARLSEEMGYGSGEGSMKQAEGKLDDLREAHRRLSAF